MHEPDITLQQLRVFVAVVELGTMTAAARALYVSQPAISAQISQLEGVVGTQLFIRKGRQMALTAVGAALYRHANNVLAATDVLLHHIERIRSGELDHFTVGGNPTSCAYVLPEILARYHRAHPGTRVSLFALQSPELLDQVRRDAVDVAILSTELVPADLPSELLGVDELVVVESAREPFSEDGTMSLAALSRAPFVQPTIGSERLTIDLDRLLASRGLEPRRFVMDLTTWEGVKEAVRMGVGLAVAPRGAVGREVDRGEIRLVAVPEYREARSIHLVQSPRWQMQHPSTAFADLVGHLQLEVPGALSLTKPERGAGSPESG
jgi:DNA-binding transcriptional LysR family regulator